MTSEDKPPTFGPSSPKGNGESNRMIIAYITVIVLPVAFFILSVMIFCLLIRRRTRTKDREVSPVGLESGSSHEWSTGLPSVPSNFSYKRLSAATDEFDDKNLLGVGGFGRVYRGSFPGEGNLVAIKRLDHSSEQGMREFMAEVRTITNIRHRNIVQLLGWCKHDRNVMLVYEYLSNGSLDKALFSGRTCTMLSWGQRTKIIYGIAAALDYLHEGWTEKVIHRDIKSSNIMLDDQFCAKIGDFGLARMNAHQRSLATTDAAGTYGYLAPEAAIFGKYTEKTDVFAFGAVALEIVCGRKALDYRLPSPESVLKDWVNTCLNQGQLMQVADPRLTAYNESEMETVLLLGLVCSAKNPLERPTMRQVLQVLSRETPMLPLSMCKPTESTYGRLPQSQFQDLLKIAQPNGRRS